MDDLIGGLLGLAGAAVLGLGAVAVGALAGAAIGAGVYFLVKLAFGAIKDWLGKSIEQHPDVDTAMLFREKLDSGNYSVMCGIFEDDELVDSQTWECEKLDDELKAEFGGKKEIIYDLTA